MHVIGIGHRSDHGKDTLADMLVKHFQDIFPNKVVAKFSWAKELKISAHRLYGHLGLQPGPFYDTDEGRLLRNIKLPKINLTPVEIWITYGSKAVRDVVWDRTWVECALHSEEANMTDIGIFADTHFHIELVECNYTIKIKNPRKPKREGLTVDNVLGDYKGWDFHMLNGGTLEELDIKAKMFATLYSKEYLSQLLT